MSLTHILGAAASYLLAFNPALARSDVTCSISATALAFGQYVPSRNEASDLTATVVVTCFTSGEEPVPVEGSIALAAGGTAGQRELSDGSKRLRYQLFVDPARTIPWGDGSGGSQTQSFSGMASGVTPFRASVTVYGRLLARQAAAPVGSYTDQITAVLNY